MIRRALAFSYPGPIQAERAHEPTTLCADNILEQQEGEVFVIPGILCNSGGVIVSYFE